MATRFFSGVSKGFSLSPLYAMKTLSEAMPAALMAAATFSALSSESSMLRLSLPVSASACPVTVTVVCGFSFSRAMTSSSLAVSLPRISLRPMVK